MPWGDWGDGETDGRTDGRTAVWVRSSPFLPKYPPWAFCACALSDGAGHIPWQHLSLVQWRVHVVWVSCWRHRVPHSAGVLGSQHPHQRLPRAHWVFSSIWCSAPSSCDGVSCDWSGPGVSLPQCSVLKPKDFSPKASIALPARGAASPFAPHVLRPLLWPTRRCLLCLRQGQCSS